MLAGCVAGEKPTCNISCCMYRLSVCELPVPWVHLVPFSKCCVSSGICGYSGFWPVSACGMWVNFLQFCSVLSIFSLLLIKLALVSQVCRGGMYFSPSVNLLSCFLVNEIILCLVLLGLGKIFCWLSKLFPLLIANHFYIFQNKNPCVAMQFFHLTI